MYLLSLSLPPSATSIKIRSFLRLTPSPGDFLLRLLRVVPSDNSRQSVPCEKCLQTHWGRNREPPWPAAMLFRPCAPGGAVVAPRFVASSGGRGGRCGWALRGVPQCSPDGAAPWAASCGLGGPASLSPLRSPRLGHLTVAVVVLFVCSRSDPS